MENPISLAVGVVLALAILLLYLGFVFLVQFYGQAIVVDGLGAIDGYRRSVRLVRRNLVPTLGYFVFVGFLGLLLGGDAGVASILVSPLTAGLLPVPALAPGVTAAVVVLALALTVLAGAFFATFSVAFYREMASREAVSGATQPGD